MKELEYDGPKDSMWEAAQLWLRELQAAHDEWEDFHERGDKILEFYTDDRKLRRTKRYPLFNANVSILENALFARIPRPEVSRRFKDPDDHVGRVVSLILQRALVTELEGNTDFKNSVKSMIKDMLVPGMGVGWVRYEADIETPQLTQDEDAELADLPAASPIIKEQSTPIDYVHWKDFRMSPCRTWNECRWVARRVFMDEAEAKKRFGEQADYLAYNTNPHAHQETDSEREPEHMIEPQAAIWEIWDKTTKKVYFICESCPTALDIKDDFLGLPDFFPTEKPLVAHTSTSKFMPVADYTQLQDQYNDLNETNNRISRLVKACRLAGVYDESQGAVKLVLEGAAEHQLIPIKNWAGFADKGGLKGAIDFIPIEQIVGTIGQLNQHREILKQQIYELTGISDIVRGASNPYETAAAQGMKAQYASVRLQGKQSDVAEYLTSLIQRKAFLMLKFYTPERLMARAGTLSQADQQFIPAALQLLQNELLTSLKLDISSDSLQQPNWAKDQAQKAQTLTALSQLLTPVVQNVPGAMEALAPIYGHIVKWGVSGNPGAAEIEGVIEMGLQQLFAAQQQPKQPQGPSPEQQAAMAAQQAEMQKAQAELQLKAQAAQTDAQLEQQKLAFEQQKFQAEMQLKAQLAQAEIEAKQQVEMAKLQLEREQFERELQFKALELRASAMQTTEPVEQGLTREELLEALNALANAPTQPTEVTIQRNADGSLSGLVS